ncbi:MAG: ABC transporter ATP-binding protein, partial [Methylobacteriaceae bacterium]|nr:ABC transporter ATP-binding protein [Methylobacteriaceae bacterium]
KLEPEATVPALKNVSFSVHRGEAFGIIGRNGSGKSTLLKVVSGILKPTSGRIAITGRVAALIELGAGFHPEITGRENIYINGIMLGLTKRDIDSRFDRIVEFSGVGPFLDQPVKTYSSGMQARLAFGLSMAIRFECYLIDEVTAVGDARFQAKCNAVFTARRQDCDIIMISHGMDTLREYCSKGVVVADGNVLFFDEIDDAIELYRRMNF